MPLQELETATHLGDYVISEKLGEGMLGTVYLATHRYLKKPFALKVLPSELSENVGFIQRFEKEVALLASLDHPNIIKIHNVSSFEGKYFLVCELHGAGKSLTDYLDKDLSEETILFLSMQIAKALDDAHKKNFNDAPLAHRGLKFNNILINDDMEVKVSDFGLTRIVGIGAVLTKTYRNIWEVMSFQAGFDKEDDEVEKLHSSFAQYYNFLAPEQKGRADSSKDTDAKADIYSFGVLLYYLLVGKYPEGFFPLPSECNPNLKKNWDPIIRKCLDVNPEKRPDFLLELLHELEETEARVILEPQEIIRPEYDPDPASVFQVDKTVAIYTPKKPDIKEMEPIDSEMVVIEGGTFLRGSNHGARDEMPRHAVHLKSFALDIHPVTNEQFVRFLTVMGGEKDANNHDIVRLRDSRIRRTGGKLTIESGYAKHPVVGVTWYGADAYAKWIGKRLPTEAEWEVAACGGLEGAQYTTGENIERSQANFFNSDTTAVMSYPPNEIGIYDLSGNVYEWCSDWYGYHYYETSMQEPEEPKGPAQGVYRSLRGGCWKSLREDMRVSHRHRNNPGTMNGTYGFRCAADVTK